MRILTLSTLFPNPVQPHHGIFVENRLRHLVQTGQVSAVVMAPVPWFPFTHKALGKYADFARVPQKETRHGLTIYHPRFPLIPKIGMNPAPRLMFCALRSKMAKIIAEHGPFDLIDAHYFYPDGVAAAHLAQAFNLPFTITARGTDINLIPRHASPKAQILWAAARANGIITVCQALKDALEELAPPDLILPSIRVLRNGVDLEAFQPARTGPVHATPALEHLVKKGRKTLLSVGHLIERKGHHLVIEALSALEGVDLLIAGTGPEQGALERLIKERGLEDRITMLGSVPHERLYEVYSAADALVLASSREGWPNVLLEAMACGTPVIATDVWGSAEVVNAPEAGVVVKERTSAALADAARTLLADLPDRTRTRAYAQNFSWDETSQGQLELFSSILKETHK